MTKTIKLSRADVDRILRNYDIGRYVSHKHIPWAISNYVYLLDTTKGKFVLKVHHKKDLDELRRTLRIERFARKEGIPVPNVIKAKNHKDFVIYHGRPTIIQEFIEGEEGVLKGASGLKHFAKTMAMVDKAMLKIPLKKKSTGLWFDRKTRVPGFDYAKYSKIVADGFEAVDHTKIRRSVIHADLGFSKGGNYLVKNNRVAAIIDWGDAHEDYLVSEPATFMTSNFISKNGVKKEQIRMFMREYQRHIKLNDAEKSAVYYLIQYRQLGVIRYAANHLKAHRNDDMRGYLRDSIKKFYVFNRMPYKEFSSLLN